MDFGRILGKLFRSEPRTEETVGIITWSILDPKSDGKFASFRVDSMPDTEFRQRANTLTSVHRTGEHVKVVYSLTSPGVATVDWIEKR
jgi:hypothetical protein